MIKSITFKGAFVIITLASL